MFGVVPVRGLGLSFLLLLVIFLFSVFSFSVGVCRLLGADSLITSSETSAGNVYSSEMSSGCRLIWCFCLSQILPSQCIKDEKLISAWLCILYFGAGLW